MLALTNALAARQDRIRNNDKGFTLIELLVVVIIIGILAAIAIPIFLGQQASARDSAVASAVTNAKTAVVAALVTGAPATDTLPEIATLLNAGTLPGYTESIDVPLSMTSGTDTFVITGEWQSTGITHRHTISDTGAAVDATP